MKTCKKGLHQYESNEKTCPECFRASQKLYREKNSEKRRQYKKAYSEKNKEAVSEYNRAYRKKNSEKLREYDRAYQAGNRAKCALAERRWAKNNRDKKRKYNVINRERHPYSNAIVAKSLGLRVHEAPALLIEAKREHIKLSRLIKEVSK